MRHDTPLWSGGVYAARAHASTPAAATTSACTRLKASAARGCAGRRYPFLTQKERDIETGLDYFEARYYSLTQGRFTSPDEFKGGPEQLFYFEQTARTNPTFYAELEEPQTLNKYQYAINNPLRYVDPDGHQAMADTLRQAGAQWEASAPPQLKIIGRVMIIAGAAAALISKIPATVENPSPCIAGLDCSAYYISKAREQANQARNADNSQNQGKQPQGQQQGENAQQTPGQKPSGQNDPGGNIQKLSKGEIKKLQAGGVDIHELKGGKGASRYDLYKDSKGQIYVKRKGGRGEGESTGLNIKDY